MAQGHYLNIVHLIGCSLFSPARQMHSVGFVELFDSPQVSSGEAADAGKLGAEIFGEILNYGASPSLALLPLLMSRPMSQ